MKDDLTIKKIDSKDEKEFNRIIINSFTKSPQLPILLKKPEKTEKLMINLMDLYKNTGKVTKFAVKKDKKLLCSGFCVDSDAKAKIFDLLKFGFKTFLLLGFRGIKELNSCNKNKPKYDKICLELMLFGTDENYQKMGLGKKMLDFLYDYAKKNNYGGVTGVTNKSKPAYKFYKKEGWVDDYTFKLDNYDFCWVRKIV